MSGPVMHEESLFEYFRTRVDQARTERTVDLTEDGALYLAQLLTERARTDHVAHEEDTLAELHARACLASPAEQASTWRELGDRALYKLGYFPENLQGRLVSPNYYATMGSSAYARVDDVLRRWFASAFGPIFHELAVHFARCVSLLEAVREAHEGHDELGRMYEEWVATGSEDLAQRLRRRGLLLPPRSRLPVS